MKKQLTCYSLNPNPQQVQFDLVLPLNPTYQDTIFYYGEKQMREELSGQAGNSIINFVVSNLKSFLKKNEISINRSQFVSFLDAWLEFLKRNSNVQDKANEAFQEWMEKLSSLLSISDNKRAWNNGVIQGFITRTNVNKLRKNIADQIQEGFPHKPPRKRLASGSIYPNNNSGVCNVLDFGVITLDLDGNLACAMLHEGSRPPPAVAPEETHKPELFICGEIGELLSFCKVFFVSGQADKPDKEKITRNQLVYYDDLIDRKIISNPFYVRNFYRIQDELALWNDTCCSSYSHSHQKSEKIGRKLLVKMPQGNMKLVTNWK
jgi:hypothetical protein